MRELDVVALARDIPDESLVKDDVGTIVAVHEEGTAYTVEFLTPDGNTIAVVTLAPEYLRPIGPAEVAHARAIS